MPASRFLRRLVSCALLVATSVFSPFYSLIVHATTPDALLPTPVRIGEVAWAGSSFSTADEWLELWNASDAPVSLAGWSLRGASDAAIVFPSDATIGPRGVFLISNYAASETKSVLATAPQLVTTAASLSNSALKIELLDETSAVVDTAGTGGAPLAGASLPIKISMIRLDPFADGSLASTWMTATTSQNLKPNVNDLGTPGICDRCGSPAAIPDPTPPPIETETTTTDTLLSDASATTDTTSSEANVETGATATTPSEATTSTTTSTLDATTTDTTSSTPADVPATQTMIDPPLPTRLPAYSPPPTSPPPKPNYNMLRLNEIAAHPASGNEWIEIATLDASQSINLRGCQIHDAAGRILTLGSRTIDPATSRYEVVKLTSARLNDGGDTVALYAPDGRLLDVMRYGKTPKGADWIRFPDLEGDWQQTVQPTPGAANALVSVSATTSDVTPAQPRSFANDVAQAGVQNQTESGMDSRLRGNDNDYVATSTNDTIDLATTTKELAALNADAARDEKMQLAERKRVAKKQAPTPPSSSASSKSLTPFTFNMLTNDDIGGARVRLTGRVGSPPGLLPSHSFILQAPDGRGLLVTVSSRQKLPDFGSDVAVVGSLRIDDRGVASLHELTHDAWSPLPSSTEAVAPRVVDLNAPGTEDAWSLAHVTGTVASVKGQLVHLDLGDAELDVLVKPIVKYRVKRLVVGDVIAVTGLLDTTREDSMRLLPRTAEEIVLVKHVGPQAAQLSNQNSFTNLPSWAPLGAAGGAVVATEGARYWNRRRKIGKLEKKAKTVI